MFLKNQCGPMDRFALEAVALASKVTGTYRFPEKLAVLL